MALSKLDKVRLTNSKKVTRAVNKAYDAIMKEIGKVDPVMRYLLYGRVIGSLFQHHFSMSLAKAGEAMTTAEEKILEEQNGK